MDNLAVNPSPNPFPNPPLVPIPAVKPVMPVPQPPLTPASTTVNEPGFTMQEERVTLKAWLKLFYLLLFIAGSIGGIYYLSKNIFNQTTGEGGGEILVSTPYQLVLWKDFGEVFEPMIKIPLYYPNQGYQNMDFLLDSGALVSSLPRDEAKKMGLSLSQLPRSTFAGFGGGLSFAYKGEAKIKLSDREVLIPVVFTEAAGTKPILGRSGFFEKYSVYFNAKTERIEIRK